VPSLVYEMPQQVSVDYKFIYAYALGYNCTYQWYENDSVSNDGGTPIEGANKFFYEPNREDGAVAYYCVITSNDGISTNSVTTNPIANLPEYRPVDLTEYNKLLDKANSVDRENADEILLNELDELLSVDVSNLTYNHQYVVDFFAGEIEFVLHELEHGFLSGDVNHDHKITAYDARMVLIFVTETDSPTRQQKRTADMNGDGEVTAMDARLILKNAVE
jgi:hypothetical protein